MDELGQRPVESVGPAQRLLFAAFVGAASLLCWRLLAGQWPNGNSPWWSWLAWGVVILLALILSPVFIVVWRCAQGISRARSHALHGDTSNVWSAIRHVEHGGSSQVMRMEDGNVVLLSIGYDTVKVFVTPRLGSPASFKELASFPMHVPAEGRRSSSERILGELRGAAGRPKSIDELHLALERLRDQRRSF